MKCQVSYSRKVSTRPYENISIGMQIEKEVKTLAEADQIFSECNKFVEDKISQKLHELEVNQ